MISFIFAFFFRVLYTSHFLWNVLCVIFLQFIQNFLYSQSSLFSLQFLFCPPQFAHIWVLFCGQSFLWWFYWPHFEHFMMGCIFASMFIWKESSSSVWEIVLLSREHLRRLYLDSMFIQIAYTIIRSSSNFSDTFSKS